MTMTQFQNRMQSHSWRPPVLSTLAAVAATVLSSGLASAQTLPPLPAAIKAAGVLKAGVRCDQPPYGYKDETGKFAGVETDMAIQIAAWAFGSPTRSN